MKQQKKLTESRNINQNTVVVDAHIDPNCEDLTLKNVGAGLVPAQRGITLITLVITIVVMLILAGVAISITVGDGSVTQHAQNAAKQWDDAITNEAIEFSGVMEILNTYIGGTNVEGEKVSTLEEANEELALGKNIILNNDITVQLEASNRETAALLQENGGIIEGNETTLTVINETGSSKVYGIQTTGGTIQNLTIIGAGRAIYGLNCGDLTLKNVVIDGCTYSFNVMGEGKLYVENSTLYGWTSMNLSTGEFVRCTLGKGTSDYSTLKPYGSIIVKDSIFEEGYIIDARMLQEDGDKITLKNCKMGNTLITEDNIATIFPDAASSIVIDND